MQQCVCWLSDIDSPRSHLRWVETLWNEDWMCVCNIFYQGKREVLGCRGISLNRFVSTSLPFSLLLPLFYLCSLPIMSEVTNTHRNDSIWFYPRRRLTLKAILSLCCNIHTDAHKLTHRHTLSHIGFKGMHLSEHSIPRPCRVKRRAPDAGPCLTPTDVPSWHAELWQANKSTRPPPWPSVDELSPTSGWESRNLSFSPCMLVMGGCQSVEDVDLYWCLQGREPRGETKCFPQCKFL